jgi:hypothetical protein
VINLRRIMNRYFSLIHKDRIINIVLIAIIGFLLVGCTHKLTREEAETKLAKCGLGTVETCGVIKNETSLFDPNFDREEILDKLADAGFIKITDKCQWEYKGATIVARLTSGTWNLGTWTIEPGPNSDAWKVDRDSYSSWANAADGASENLHVNRFDVVINNPENSNLEIKDDKIKIITKKYSNFKVTGIMEVSPTEDMVQYTAEETATPEGAAIGAKGSGAIEGTMKFMRYDDGWRPEL